TDASLAKLGRGAVDRSVGSAHGRERVLPRFACAWYGSEDGQLIGRLRGPAASPGPQVRTAGRVHAARSPGARPATVGDAAQPAVGRVAGGNRSAAGGREAAVTALSSIAGN